MQELNQARFEAAKEIVLANRRRKGIGTLGEKTLHAVLKQALEPSQFNHEIKIGPYVADIVGEHGIIEIQTRGLNQLRDKLTAFLEVANVTVVHPITRNKWVVWIDPATGEIAERRKSPKKGIYHHAFDELYGIKPLLGHSNLEIRLPLLDAEEYRLLDGRGDKKKKGGTRHERVPIAFAGELCLRGPADYRAFLPDTLEGEFTSQDFREHCRIPLPTAQTALNILHHMEVVERFSKRGRYYLYRQAPLEDIPK